MTPIYPAKSFSRRRRSNQGFTLIELMVILVLLVVLMFVALPAFQNMIQGRVEEEVKHLSGVIRLLRNEAVLGRKSFRIVFKVEQSLYTVEEKGEDGNYLELDHPAVLKPHRLPDSFVIDRIFMYGKDVSRDRKVPVPVGLDSSGFIDPFLLQFTEGDTAHTLRVTGFMGKADLVEGHVFE